MIAHEISGSFWDDSAPFPLASGGCLGDGRARVDAGPFDPCSCGRSEKAAQGRDPAVDGGRSVDDRHVGHEARPPTGGPFKPISTTGNVQICEHLPFVAKQMHHLAIVRSMSTREADHTRGRYYMHTGYVPNPNVEHPSYGAVVAHEMSDQRRSWKSRRLWRRRGQRRPRFPGHDLRAVHGQHHGNVRNLKWALTTTGSINAWPRWTCSKKASSARTAASQPRITRTSWTRRST